MNLRTSYESDSGASCSSGEAKTSEGAKSWIGTCLVDMIERGETQVFAHPVGVDVFGSLVNREGNGSHERYAGQRSRDTYRENELSVCHTHTISYSIPPKWPCRERHVDSMDPIGQSFLRTSKEAAETLGLVSCANTIDESIVRVRLHACFYAIERERRDCGHDTGRAGGDLCTVSLHPPAWPVGFGGSSGGAAAAAATAGELRHGPSA